jgi:DNA-binding transcriptional MerR regulator
VAQADDRTYGIDDLCTLVDLPKRTIRYYIQIGLVDRPDGETRAARYGPRHLEQLLGIRRWTQAGLSLERIRELLSDPAEPPPSRARTGTIEVWSHLVVAEGVEIRLNPEQARLSPDQARQFFAAVTAAFQHIKQEQKTA